MAQFVKTANRGECFGQRCPDNSNHLETGTRRRTLYSFHRTTPLVCGKAYLVLVSPTQTRETGQNYRGRGGG